MPRRACLAIAVASLLCFGASCDKKAAPAAAAPTASEHTELTVNTPAPSSQVILAKTFTLKTSETFPFEIPSHSLRPHLHGIFQSTAGQEHGPSDSTANIDFLVMNEAQQAEFANKREGEALFSVEASHNQSVNFDLPSSFNQPVKYFLLFRSNGGKVKVVQANFRVDF
jgi:hypothetical protein